MTTPTERDRQEARQFEGLSVPQTDALGMIATGSDGSGIRRDVLAVLERKGYIVSESRDVYGNGRAPINRIPVRVRVYSVPLAVHARWCAWCATLPNPQAGGDRG